MKQLMELELTIFILILCGAFFKRKGIIGEVGQKNLTDLVIDLILPCNIIVSFTSRLSESALTDCVQMLLISSGIQVMAVRVPARSASRRTWWTVCPTSGFPASMATSASSSGPMPISSCWDVIT